MSLLWYNLINEGNTTTTMCITILLLLFTCTLKRKHLHVYNNSSQKWQQHWRDLNKGCHSVAWPCNNESVAHTVGITVGQLL